MFQQHRHFNPSQPKSTGLLSRMPAGKEKLINVSFAKNKPPMAKILTGKNSTKKEVIIQKAAFLFKSKSFAAASMRELAEALGVEAASLYNHIGSKNELLQAICSRIANKFTLQME